MKMEAPSLIRKHTPEEQVEAQLNHLRIRGVAGKLTRRVLARFHMTRVEFQILTKTLIRIIIRMKLQMAHKLK